MYTKESLERLKEKIDLIELISSHIDLKAAGSTYKGLCPFHDEKSPSFSVKRGDSHYHCFGCGAHGDAIHFLMSHMQLSFHEAVESLAERFHVALEVTHQKGASEELSPIKEALELANQFYHYCLLETPAGKEAQAYLLQRGIDLSFIRRFYLGYAPEESHAFRKVMRHHRISDETLFKAGLVTKQGGDFFRGRITFPIRASYGQIVGFSARSFREGSFGGKYINTPETALFKKSHLLFGLNYSRRRIAKEGMAIIVEGQIDALRLIDKGLHYVVAALGTAFGKEHVAQLKKLGVKKSYLLFDGDKAGRGAASKVGDLLQEVGIDVVVASLPEGSDPDSYLREHSIESLCSHIEKGENYLEFQFRHLSSGDSPAEKAHLVKTMQEQIERWEEPIMVHESLKKLALLADLPQQLVHSNRPMPSPRPKKKEQVMPLDGIRILEMDLLRWLILKGEEKSKLKEMAFTYLTEAHFFDEPCRKLYLSFLRHKRVDLLESMIESEDEGMGRLLDEIMEKKVPLERAELLFVQTVQKLCDRLWLKQTEEIKKEMEKPGKSEEEMFALMRQFDALKNQRCVVT